MFIVRALLCTGSCGSVLLLTESHAAVLSCAVLCALVWRVFAEEKGGMVVAVVFQ